MNNYQKVRPGDSLRISAGLWNDILDVVKAHKNQKDNLGVEGRGVGRGTFILVKNDTGADLDRFDAVALSAPIITPTANETEFLNNFAMVGSSEGTGRAVFQEPVAAGKIGRAMVMGVTPIRKGGAIAPASFGTVLWEDADWALILLGGGGTTMRYTAFSGLAYGGGSEFFFAIAVRDMRSTTQQNPQGAIAIDIKFYEVGGSYAGVYQTSLAVDQLAILTKDLILAGMVGSMPNDNYSFVLTVTSEGASVTDLAVTAYFIDATGVFVPIMLHRA